MMAISTASLPLTAAAAITCPTSCKVPPVNIPYAVLDKFKNENNKVSAKVKMVPNKATVVAAIAVSFFVAFN
nr:hypothetical protein [Niallia nealsonii]